MNTKTFLKTLFLTSAALLLGFIAGWANYVACAGPLGTTSSAAVGQQTHTTFQLARGPVGPLGTSGQSGSPSKQLPGGIPGRGGTTDGGDTRGKTVPSSPEVQITLPQVERQLDKLGALRLE